MFMMLDLTIEAANIMTAITSICSLIKKKNVGNGMVNANMQSGVVTKVINTIESFHKSHNLSCSLNLAAIEITTHQKNHLLY